MTSPASSTPQSGNARKIWLERYILVQVRADRKLTLALQAAAKDLDAEMSALEGKSGVGVSVRRSQLVGARGVITKTLVELFGIVGQIIRGAQAEAVAAANAADVEWAAPILREIEPNAARREALESALKATADRNIQAMIVRVLHTEMPLSAQVYKTRHGAQAQVGRIVNSSLARGDSAADIAKKVFDFIRPDTPGGAAYAARRLARTEINNAFHAQAIENARDRPWVVGMRWHLSKTHKPKPGDLCETYARIGVTEVESTPRKPHPQCMCFVTPEVEQLDITVRRSRNGEFASWYAEKVQ